MEHDMEPFEKEEVFCAEIHSTIDHFCTEYKMTFAQVIGCLEIVKCEIQHEAMENNADET